MNRLFAPALIVSLLSAPALADHHATIIRDKFGVPHVFGKSAADVGFGFGYAQAEDRLETILRSYLKACGKEASVFGLSYLDSDRFTHLARIPEIVAEKYAALDPEVKGYVEGFAAGIAHYMKTHADKVPEWGKPPSAQDVLTYVKHQLMQPSISTALSEGRRLLPPPKKEEEEEGEGGTRKKPRRCNAWAIGKSKSQTGHAMLQMDQHMSYYGTGQWYEAHLCGGPLNVVGATHFGHPFLLIGHNEHIAWTTTANSPDTADVYFEQMKSDNPNQYLYDETWHKIQVRKAKIPVKKGDKVEDREVALEYTLHGPVFLHTHEKIYSAKWTDGDDIQFAPQYFGIHTAKSVDDFKKAMSLLGIPRGNYICADAAGSLFYVYNARVAQKSDEVNWSCPVPGWTTETDWGEIIPFAQLPQVTNPECGFVQNCNDPPAAVTPDGDVDVEEAPPYLVRSRRASPGARGERATKLLEDTEKFTFKTFMAVANDNHSPTLIRTKTRMLDAYAIQENKGSEKVQQAMKLLKEWDGNCTADNVALMYYKMWRMEMRKGSAPKGSRSTLLAMERAVDKLMALYKRIDVKWAPHHVIERGGKTFPIAAGGSDAQTLFMASAGSLRDGKWQCTSGSTYRMAVELCSPPKSFSIFPLGMSDDPASPHCTDMTALYAQGKYKPVWFTKENISANKEREYTVESK